MEEQETNSSDSIDTSSSASFDDDLLMEIFSRLPLKSLFRFKCVSRAWYCLISNHRQLEFAMSGLFYQLHLIDNMGHSQLKEHKFISMSGSGCVANMSLSFLPCHPNFKIIDCCNGLLLCLSRESKQVIFSVCNPITMEYVLLPRPRNRFAVDNARLTFDSQVGPHHKVICLLGQSERSSSTTYITLEIFSSDSGKWVESKVPCDTIVWSLQPQRAVYLNGTLHMLAFPHCVVGINLEEQSCRIINLPGSKHCCGLLGLYRKCLHYVSYENSIIEMWMHKDYQSNDWLLKCNISFQALEELSRSNFAPSVCQYPSQFHLLALHPDFDVVFLEKHCKLYSYDFVSARLEEICSVTCMRESRYHFSKQQTFWTFPFTPCLNSLAMKGAHYSLAR